MPSSTRIIPNTFNAVFYPHAAHSRVERQGTVFDPWIPSSKFLTHVLLSDEPRVNRNALGTMIVGGRGIWGRLSGFAEETLRTSGESIVLAKAAFAEAGQHEWRSTGRVGTSPEVWELPSSEQEFSMIVAFSHQPVDISYRLRGPVEEVGRILVPSTKDEGPSSRELLRLKLDADDAAIVSPGE